MTNVRVAGHTLDEQDALAEEFTQLMTDELNKILAQFTALVRHEGLIAAGVPTTPEEIFAQWSATSEGVLADFTQSVYTSGANSIAEKVASSSLVPLGSGVPGLPASYSASYVQKATNKIKTLAPSMWQGIQTELVAGTAAGESIDKLADRVAKAGSTTVSHGQLIARTEVIGASNTGSFAQAALLGGDEGVSKVWEATEDIRTRPDHRHADGQTVALHATFDVGGYQMLHPGDDTAPASEVCNCRCTIVYEFDDSKVSELCPGGGTDCVTAPDKLPAPGADLALPAPAKETVPAVTVKPLAVTPVNAAPTSTTLPITADTKNKIYKNLGGKDLFPGDGEDVWEAAQNTKITLPEAAGLSDLQLAKVLDDVNGTGTFAQDAMQAFLNTPKGKDAVKEFADAQIAPVAPPPTPAVTVTVPDFGGSGNISNLTDRQAYSIKNVTLTDSTITSPNKNIWQTVLQIQNSAAGEDLNALQVLRAMDALFAQHWGVTNEHWYETKILKWAKTDAGKKVIADAKYVPKWGKKLTVKTPSSFDKPGTPKPKTVTTASSSGVSGPLGTLPKLAWNVDETATSYPEISLSEAKQMLDSNVPWTGEQKDALRYYTGNHYQEINSWLRGHTADSLTNERDKVAARQAQAGMRPSKRAMTLWRGTAPSQFGLGSHASYDDLRKLIGKRMQDKGFMSTSVGGRAAFGGSVILQIEAPVGSEMAYVAPISQFQSENEMLLAAGTRYEVIDVYQSGRQTIVKGRIIS